MATEKSPLKDTFTSTGAKFFHHQEAMMKLRDGHGMPVVTHLMPTDVCQDTCAFCSVQTRAGDRLALDDMESYLRILVDKGLKAVIISGGGNPLLYICPKTGRGFNDLITMIRQFGLDIGVITNGMPLETDAFGRKLWRRCSAESLDSLTWVRISMAGLDHKRNSVEVPDIDPSRTTLGFSYVYHDLYDCPEELHHRKVSTVSDLIKYAGELSAEEIESRKWSAAERMPVLTQQIADYVNRYNPEYVRVLPNCLERDKILDRCATLQGMANAINPDKVFVQSKPPSAPNACFLGYVHPVLNSDGYVYPCDSVVLNTEVLGEGEHKFGSPWRICHWSDVASIYEKPIRSLVDPKTLCPGCVFTGSNLLLESVVDGSADITPRGDVPTHVNFV